MKEYTKPVDKKLRKKRGLPEGYFYAYINDKKYSVVDFGHVLRNFESPSMFRGWEATEINEEHNEPIVDSQKRANSWKELKKML